MDFGCRYNSANKKTITGKLERLNYTKVVLILIRIAASFQLKYPFKTQPFQSTSSKTNFLP